MWADLGTLKMRWAEQLISLLNFIKENLRRASKESITVIKPGENKRGNESFGGLIFFIFKLTVELVDTLTL